jgi:hypothetical protein
MPIRLISFYTYRSKGLGDWTDPEVGVLRFVRAIKHEPLANAPDKPDLGYVLVNGLEPKRELRQDNANDAFDWFGEMAVHWIRRELGTLGVALVPVPDSGCIQGIVASRTRALADAIVKRANVAVVADVLRWSEKMVPAHRGGPREPLLLCPKLRVPTTWSALPRQHVLVDDVATSGGHLRACAAVLKTRGVSVPLAVCGAQAEQYFAGDPYKERIQDYDDFEMPEADQA